MPPESWLGIKSRRTAQTHSVQLHQNKICDQLVVEIGVHLQRKRNVVEDVQVREQRGRLKQHANVAPHIKQLAARHRADVSTVEQHHTRIRAYLSADDPQQRRFASAARTHDRGDAAARHAERQAVEHHAIAAGELQVADFDQRRL